MQVPSAATPQQHAVHAPLLHRTCMPHMYRYCTAHACLALTYYAQNPEGQSSPGEGEVHVQRTPVTADTL